MAHLLVNWLLGALALWLVARIIPGITVRGFGAALGGTIAIAVVNFFLKWPLSFLTFPLIFLTLGLFKLVINAFLLKVASLIVPGFAIKGFLAAFLGSIVLTVLTAVMRFFVWF